MENQPLLLAIKTTLQKTKVDQLAKIVAAQMESVPTLIDLTFHQDLQIGFRAAWILEQVYIKYQEQFLPHLLYFLKRFTEQENAAAKRHYGKILALMTCKKASEPIKLILATADTAKLVDVVFDWLIDPKTPVAVKAHCLDVLANFCTVHPWIKDELLSTIDYLIDKESIAFHLRAQKTRSNLIAH
jgi:hypothetical protein